MMVLGIILMPTCVIVSVLELMDVGGLKLGKLASVALFEMCSLITPLIPLCR
jgi:hypothetical protein